jgi:hypothetical protein
MTHRFLAIIIVVLSVTASADTGPAQTSVPGDVIRYDTKNGGMLATAGIDWDRYTKIQLEKATVEFRENWVQDQQRVNNTIVRESDIAQIKSGMSKMLDQVLRRRIADNEDLTLTDERGANVLRFTPQIKKLDINAPAIAQEIVGHVLVDSMGSMVLVMDISDSTSGEILASSWQLQVDMTDGYMDTASSARNKTAFKQMMEHWARWYFELLDYVRTHQKR